MDNNSDWKSCMYSPRAEYLTYLRLLLFPIGHTIPCWLMKSTSTNLFWPHFSFDQPQEIGTTLTPLYWYGNEAQRDEVHLRGYRGHGESKGDWSPINPRHCTRARWSAQLACLMLIPRAATAALMPTAEMPISPCQREWLLPGLLTTISH